MAERHAVVKLLDEAGPRVFMSEAAQVLGCSRGTADAMAQRGELAALGVRVLRLGRHLRVSTASLRRVVGIDEPTDSDQQ